jgi:hypothetical protein
MFQDMFARSRRVRVFGEADKRAMTEQWRMRDEPVIEDLVGRSDRKVTLFKPLNESQWADRLLDHFPSGRAIWMFRNPFDTVNSAVDRWGSAQLDMMTWIAEVVREAGSLEKAQRALDTRPSYSMYAERLSADDCDRLLRWTEQPLDVHAGAAILWYLRNRFFFNLQLYRNQNTILMSYEELVQSPERQIRRICEFIELRYSKKYARKLHTNSIGKSPRPPLPAEIEEAVLALHGSLCRLFARQYQVAHEHVALEARNSC